MMTTVQYGTELVEELRNLLRNEISSQDRGDNQNDTEKSVLTILDDLETKLSIADDMQKVAVTRNKRLIAENEELKEKVEIEKQKYKMLQQGHEKFAKMKAEYKQMARFVKEQKAKAGAVTDSYQENEARPKKGPAEKTKEPCITLTRTELYRLEEDMKALRDVLARREETWKQGKEHEKEARAKVAALSTEVYNLRQLAMRRRAEIESRSRQLEDANEQIAKHKLEISKLRGYVVRLRNRERDLLTQISKNMASKCSKHRSKKRRKNLLRQKLQKAMT